MRRSRCVLILTLVLLMATFVGCANSGTGLSENEEYLALLSADNVLGIVIKGDYYLLPEPLSIFIENGWAPSAISQQYGDLDTIILPPMSYMDLRLEKDGMRMRINVLNNAELESMHILDASVTRIALSYGVEKDQAVVVGGITGNTSRDDATAKLQELNIDHTDSVRIVLVDDAHYGGKLTMTSNGGLFNVFSVELHGRYAIDEGHAEFFPEDFLADLLEEEKRFLDRSYYFEGTVTNLYYIVRTERDDDTFVAGNAVVAVDDRGDMFAFRLNSGTNPNSVALEDIPLGSEVTVYYGPTEHSGSLHQMISYEGRGNIPYVRADVLRVDGEIEHSIFRR